jgi:hypothetical protein
MRREESTRTSVASMSPSKEVVTRHGQTLLLLLKVRSHIVVGISRCGISERIVSFCLVVDVRVTLDVMVGSGDSHSAGDMDVAEVDAVWSCHLFRCKLYARFSTTPRRMSYHSMHADDSYRKSH